MYNSYVIIFLITYFKEKIYGPHYARKPQLATQLNT